MEVPRCPAILCVSLVPHVCIVLLSCLYFLLPHVCIAVLHNLVGGLLARIQYPQGPATGHLGTGFSWFPCV